MYKNQWLTPDDYEKVRQFFKKEGKTTKKLTPPPLVVETLRESGGGVVMCLCVFPKNLIQPKLTLLFLKKGMKKREDNFNMHNYKPNKKGKQLSSLFMAPINPIMIFFIFRHAAVNQRST